MINKNTNDILAIILFVCFIFLFIKTKMSKIKNDINTEENNKQKEYLKQLTIQINTEKDNLYTEKDNFKLEKKEILQQLNSDKVNFENEKKDKLNQLNIQMSNKLELERRNLLKDIEIICAEKSKGFPWLAKAYSDYFALKDMEIVKYLENKNNPAYKAAEILSDYIKEKKELNEKYKIAKYTLDYYENLFPWLVDLQDGDLDNLIEINKNTNTNNNTKYNDEDLNDSARKYLTDGEYKKLSTTEKYQLALDRYWKRNKSKWEIGKDFERYIGYKYEKLGYSVKYEGIIKGFEDMGRDLICWKNNSSVSIIQCKYWSKSKTIHEKHINQLFGTTVMYWIKNMKSGNMKMEDFFKMLKSGMITPILYTSTILSPTAKSFADALGVKYYENCTIEKYPLIKCNISSRDGEKIYHLPFDQKYDKVQIGKNIGETYVETVKEAEGLGFRHAYRWNGNKLSNAN